MTFFVASFVDFLQFFLPTEVDRVNKELNIFKVQWFTIHAVSLETAAVVLNHPLEVSIINFSACKKTEEVIMGSLPKVSQASNCGQLIFVSAEGI